jgi:hypothetical protein
MTRSSKGGIAAILLACASLCTCARSLPPPAAAPSPPSAEQTEANYGYKSGDTSAASPSAPSPRPEGKALRPTSESGEDATATQREAEQRESGARPTAALRQAAAEWDRARAALEAAAADCGLACRALASMERALVHLCALATLPDEQPRCEEARRLLADARDRVRRACGSCPGGPSVDRNAPVPSSH